VDVCNLGMMYVFNLGICIMYVCNLGMCMYVIWVCV